MLHDTLYSTVAGLPHDDGHHAASNEPLGHAEVSRLLAVIADQIADADRRHCEALGEMKSRLQQLGTDTRLARPQVPDEFAPAFERIEDALAQLAERISQARTERAAAATAAQKSGVETGSSVAASAAVSAPLLSLSPMVLRSAAPLPEHPNFNWAADFTRNRSDAPAADRFDVVDNSGAPKLHDVWTYGDAEALTRVYEEAAAPPEPQFAPAAMANAVSAVDAPAAVDATVPAVQATPELAEAATEPVFIAEPVLVAEPIFIAEPVVPAPNLAVYADRDWIDERFAALSSKIQASLDETPVHDMLTALDERLVQLETHLGRSLQDVAKRSDVEGLKLVEAHIDDISRHLEKTTGQLGRLDGIEAQLNEVVEHLAAQFEQRSMAPAAMPAEDVERIASQAAETVATRFAGSMASAMVSPPADQDNQLASVRGLLESYIGERRDGDEHNALMLDTLQQALIRVLDRIDAMEMAQTKVSHQPAAHAYSVPAPRTAPPPYQVERQRDASPVYVASDTAQIAPAPAAIEMHAPSLQAPGVAPDQAQSDQPQSGQAQSGQAQSGVGRLRQDMIADAQRAKLRASAVQAAQPVSPANMSLDAAARSIRSSAQAAMAASEAKTGLSAVSPKLIVAAVALMAVLGAWSMATSAPDEIASESPAAALAATTAVPSMASATAVKPQTSAPVAATPQQKGLVFEANPGAAPAAAPVAPPVAAAKKISMDATWENGSDELPPGIRLRQSSEPVSPVNLAILQHQQNLANLSVQLGETAVNTLTPAAFMKEVPITALSVTAAPNALIAPAASGEASAEAKTTDVKASALDLPPVTVGPLSLRLAAAKGDASAEFEAASRLAEGKGTSQNFKEALRWYQRSAAQGFAQAQYRLGTLYERGLGIKADAGHARAWYQRAADQGNVKAMHNLAVLSASRLAGSPDYVSAAKWFTAAAERDLQDSQYNLGVLFESGLGVEKDAKQAMKWYSLAARSGDAESTRRRDMIKAQLAPQDVAEAVGAVTAFEAVKVEDPLINDARAAGEDWKKRMGTEGQG